jgi:hypothetical protein
MAKQLTAPGCKYSIVARVGTTIYSPDQKWTLDVPAGQTDFIAETNEIIIPADAMMCRKKCQIDADLARVNILGRGAGSLATFVTRAIEQIVGKGNAKVIYGDGKLTVALASSVTTAQMAAVESLLDRMLPKDVESELAEADGFPVNYTRLEYLESNNGSFIDTQITATSALEVICVSEIVERGSAIYGARDGLNVNEHAIWNGCSTVKWGSQRIYTSEPTYERIKTRLRNAFYINDELIAQTNDTVWASKHSFFLFAVNDVGHALHNSAKLRIYSFSVFDAGKIKNNLVPALDPTGTPCMYDVITRKAFRNNGTGQFIAGMTTEQARDLANLPATGGSLTVSLPLEAAFDEAVQNALNTATARGWTITVRYRESELTTENIDVDFLESAGGSFIDTEIVPTNETGLSLTALPMSDLDTIPFGSRNSNSTESRFYAVRPRRLRTGTIDRLVANGFGWGGWVVIGENIQGVPKKEETYLNWLNARSAISEHAAKYLLPLPFTPEFSMYLFAANISNSDQLYYIGRIWNAAVSVGTQLKANFIPALDSAGAPCMHDTVSGQNFYNANTTEGAVPFIAGFDTTEKAAVSLSKLPVTTDGTLTVSLPAAAKDEASWVPEACRIAAQRGWTIFPQYRKD